jgi:hypothetical protein
MPRQYEPAWQALKKNGKVRLAVPRPLHKRVIKAILKEKWMDTGFKYEMLEKKIRLRIEYVQEANVITMYLLQIPTFLSSVTLADL